MSFQEACQSLKDSSLIKSSNYRPVRTPTSNLQPNITPPVVQWQAEAWRFVQHSQQILFSDVGTEKRRELHHRGLTNESVKHWQLGYNPTRQSKPLSDWGLDAEVGRTITLFDGIVIPGVYDDNLWYVGQTHRGPVSGLDTQHNQGRRKPIDQILKFPVDDLFTHIVQCGVVRESMCRFSKRLRNGHPIVSQ